MKVVVVGGGKVGYFVTKDLLERGYEVKLIEINKPRCERIATELDASVLCADGTMVESLSLAGTGKANAFIAVTGSDENNIVACEIAKRRFAVKKTIARSNNPYNLTTMHRLGVDYAVSSTKIITDLIEMEVDSHGMRLLTTINKGEASIVEINVPQNWAKSGSMLKNLRLPRNCIIVAISRDEKMLIPHGDTTIHAGDHVTAVVTKNNRHALEKIFRTS